MESIMIITNKYPNITDPNVCVFVQQLVWTMADLGYQCMVIVPLPINLNKAFVNFPEKKEEVTENTPYSRYKENQKKSMYDLYFCGSVKGRAELLKNINDKLKNDVSCSWDIFSNKSTNSKEIECIQTFTRCRDRSEVIPYSEVLERTMKAGCILDIVQKGQNGNTIRYYEAICNDKKLLTNNRSVLNSKYYDPRYIQYFSKAEEIDVEWIKRPCEVNFGYQGEFSPEILIRKFISECEEKNDK